VVGNNVRGVLGAEADMITGEDSIGPKLGVILPAI